MYTLAFILFAVAAIVGSLVLGRWVARYEPVRSAAWGIFSVELRRRAQVDEHPSGLGGGVFRQPCERRLRVFRVAGLPVWRQGHSVNLPLQVAGMIGTLTARDFDAEFQDRFRVASFDKLVPAWLPQGRGRKAPAKHASARATKRMPADLLHK